VTKRRKLWGWGYEGESADPAAVELAVGGLSALLGGALERQEPRPPAQPAPSRITPTASLASLFDASPHERLRHSLGQSFFDLARAIRGEFPRPPDLVAFPRSDGDVGAVLSFAEDAGAAVIPFGGGTSVHGGVEARGIEGPVIALDLTQLSGVVEFDVTSRLARVRGGTLGPDLESGLASHGLSLRHFPQSFELSTLGGWIATRAGGHFATGPTHIDDLVAAVEVVTPRGRVSTRSLPGSGAGPDPNRLFFGSEGTLGIITEATLRVFARPTARASATVRFPREGELLGDGASSGMTEGLDALRAILQAGLLPANARLLDPVEALTSGAGSGDASLLLLAFESAELDVRPLVTVAVEVARAHGGRIADSEIRSSNQGSGKNPTAESYRAAFFRAPYLRDELALRGVFAETYETAAPWSKIAALDLAVRGAVRATVRGPSLLARRITHAYRDGCAPYYTLLTRAAEDPGAQWNDVKQAITEAILSSGGTVTHHHAVGRDLARAWQQEVPPLVRGAWLAAKAHLDPRGLLNPGVLFGPP
jgi:alkyldihydroxyacetonephosphate synthase